MCAVGRSADALVATEDGVVIGHAMAVDVIGPDGGRVADVGLVVTDHWQNRGIGSEMLRMVVARAAARGVRGLVMEVLPENRRILAMISRRWAGAGYESGGGSVTIRVRLPDPHGEAGSAATAGLPARADGARGGLGGSRVDTAKGRGHGTAVRAA
jgi:hypothetical protein